ncbi:unnamed protein product [Effrenium voratum]|nr:unnamed protein product [Effrenium voratum]
MWRALPRRASFARGAFWLCRESQRQKPLVQDPFACLLSDALLSDAERQLTETAETQEEAVAVTHTAFVDRLLLDSVSKRVRQVVLWPSGVDTRAFRLQLPPQLRIFEVDEAKVHEAKATVLDAAGARPRALLRRLWPEQLEQVLDRRKPCLFILDGKPQDATTADFLHELAPDGSTLVAQIRPPVPEGVEAASSELAEQLRSWRNLQKVPDLALKGLFQDRAPAPGKGVLLVAEKGMPEAPQRPSVANATRKDGAPMSSYGWRGD